MKTKTLFSANFICSLFLLVASIVSCKKEEITTSALAASNSSDVVAKQSLVAWYKFTKGNTADYSGNNNHLTAYNVKLAADYLGRPNNAYAFDGTSSYMMADNSNSLNPSAISLVALVKPIGFYNGVGESSRIFMKGVDDQSNGDYFLGFLNNGQVYGTYGDNQYNSNGVISPASYLQLDNWYKIIYTYSGTVGKLYVNGTLVGTQNKVAVFNANTAPLLIGKTLRADFPYFFNGVIDEIRIYNVALNSAQVAKVDAELGK